MESSLVDGPAMFINGWRTTKHAKAMGSAQNDPAQISVRPMTAKRTTAADCTPMIAPRQPKRRCTSGTINPVMKTKM
jgi:hypothetical protein